MSEARHLDHDWYPRPLPANVVIGAGSWLYSSFAMIHYRSRRPVAVRVGAGSGVYNGSFFDLGPCAEVEIGDYSTLVGVIVASNGRVRIGSYCFLAHEVVIADSPAARPPPPSIADPAADEPEMCVTLGDDVWVGTGAVLLKGARIGAGAIVAAGAVVDFEVPPNTIVAGNPGRVVGSASAK